MRNKKSEKIFISVVTGTAMIIVGMIMYQKRRNDCNDVRTVRDALNFVSELNGPLKSELKDNELGNLVDMKQSGSLHEYLVDLTQKYGPSFVNFMFVYCVND